jgi:transposase-like protein
MKTKKSDFVEQVTFRVNADAVKAIQKSGQSAPDWFRQAARNRLESKRNSGNPHDAVDGRMNRLEQEVAQLRKEIVKLQQSESIVQAALLDMRRTLTAVQQNQVEFRHLLERQDASFGIALNTLGSSLLVALSRQLDQQLQKLTVKVEEDPPVKRWPPAPPRTQL